MPPSTQSNAVRRTRDPFEEHLGKFIAAQGCRTPDEADDFRFACGRLAIELGMGGPAFNSLLFAELRRRAGMATNATVALHFRISRAQTPLEFEVPAPALMAEGTAAAGEVSEYESKLIEARAREQAAAQKVRKIQYLTKEVERMRRALDDMETWPASIEARIAGLEDLIMTQVFDLPPNVSMGSPLSWAMNVDENLATHRATLKAHPERMKRSRAVLAKVETDLAESKRPPRRKHRVTTRRTKRTHPRPSAARSFSA